MKFLFLLIIYSHLSFAGEKGGNGGDAVVCRNNNQITSIELLDHYEGRIFRNMITDQLSDTLSTKENLEILFSALKAKMPNRAKLYLSWYATFFDETLMLEGNVLEDIPDSDHLSFPVGCKVEQLAVQQTPKFPQDKRYIINADLWKKLSPTSQAGLIMHELMYREVIETRARHPQSCGNLNSCSENPINSIEVRFFNTYLSTKEFESLNQQEIHEIMRKLTFFRYFEMYGISELIYYPYSAPATIYKYQVARGINNGIIWGMDSKDVRVHNVQFKLDVGPGVTYQMSFQFEDDSITLTASDFNYQYVNGSHIYSKTKLSASEVHAISRQLVMKPAQKRFELVVSPYWSTTLNKLLKPTHPLILDHSLTNPTSVGFNEEHGFIDTIDGRPFTIEGYSDELVDVYINGSGLHLEKVQARSYYLFKKLISTEQSFLVSNEMKIRVMPSQDFTDMSNPIIFKTADDLKVCNDLKCKKICKIYRAGETVTKLYEQKFCPVQ